MGWFVNPGMLFFASFGSIPIIIHLLNRQKFKRIQWAAMTFLLAAIKRTHSRLRIENLLLLLVRIAIMVLLSLALAQPLVENNPIGGVGETEIHLILAIDNSYSMGLTRAGHPSPFETARTLGSELLARLDASRGDKVSLVTMSDNPEGVIAEPSMQIDFARKKVAELELSDYGTSAFKTFALILAAAKKSTNAHREVVVLTDFQRLAWAGDDAEKEKFRTLLTDLVSVPGVNVRLVDVGVDQASNLTVDRLVSESKVVGTDKDYKFIATVHNYGREDAQRYLTWYVDGAKHDTVPVAPSAGDAADVSLSIHIPEAGPHYLTAELDSDPIQADNRASLAFDAKQNVQVLLVDGEPSPETFEDEVIFLRLALNPSMTADERVSLYDVETVRDIVFSETDVRKYDLVIIANLEAIYDENVANLEAYVKAGGGLLLFLGDRVDTRGYNDRLYKGGNGLLPCDLGVVAGDPSKQKLFNFEKVDFEHPALKYFEHFQSKLTDLPIYAFVSSKIDEKRKDKDIRVLARFNDTEGTPAIVEKTWGRGKVILVTTSADYEWNEMVGDQGYLILVDQLAKYLVAQQDSKNVEVGSSLQYFLRADQFNRSFSLLLPKQGTASLAPSQIGDSGFVLKYDQTENAGVYTLEKPAEPGANAPENQVLSYFAVNVDPREGNLDRIGEEELRQRFPEFKFTYQREGGKGEEEGKGDKRPRSSRAWRLLAYAALGMLLAEMYMAQRFGARR